MTKNPMATHSHHDFKSSNNDNGGGDDNKYNIFRDSLMRYCGYANEVGARFRYQYPRLVGPSYILAFGYCLADSVSAGYQVMMSSEKDASSDVNNKDVRSKEIRAAIAMFDTLLWVSRRCI